MANTANFNWETPDDTDLVKDGAAAIRTLGSAIDTSLVDLKGGTTGQVLSKATGTDMDFTWVAQDDANAIQNALLTTTGDTIYASGASTPARLGIGSTGQVLTVAGGVPSWATPAGGGGKVLQVVQATYSTQTSNSTSTYADTGLTVNITPSSATSKVLVFYSLAASKSSGNGGNGLNLKLLRGATVIAGYESVGLGYTGTTIQSNFNVAQQYLDSPATTSATTYKLQFCNDTIQASVSVQHANTTSIITLMEIGA